MSVDKSFTDAIEAYLNQEAITNVELREAMKKEDRNINGCCDYILSEVRKLANKSKAYAMRDDAVYEIAKNYYFAEKIEVPKAPVPMATVTASKPVPKPPVKPESGIQQLSLF